MLPKVTQHRTDRKVRRPLDVGHWTMCNAKWFCILFVAKLPKNCDPNSTPDPERWLPLRERSYYRGKRKSKKRDAG